MDRTRARILAAARAVLLAPPRRAQFSIDAVARHARVTRATVYHHFGSRTKLLEALFDDLAARGGMWDLADAFRQPDPEQGLARYVATFGRFWTAYRQLHRRLRALAALDPALDRTLQARQEWRRESLRALVERLRKQHALAAELDETIDVLFTLTGFETFDTLAGAQRRPADVTAVVLRLARAASGLNQMS